MAKKKIIENDAPELTSEAGLSPEQIADEEDPIEESTPPIELEADAPPHDLSNVKPTSSAG